MIDLISRQAAIAYSISGMTREIDGEKWIRVSEVRESIKTMPSAQPERLVRCKDCKYRDTFNCGMQFYGYDDDMNLQKSDDWTKDDGYCYWGERKDV